MSSTRSHRVWKLPEKKWCESQWRRKRCHVVLKLSGEVGEGISASEKHSVHFGQEGCHTSLRLSGSHGFWECLPKSVLFPHMGHVNTVFVFKHCVQNQCDNVATAVLMWHILVKVLDYPSVYTTTHSPISHPRYAREITCLTSFWIRCDCVMQAIHAAGFGLATCITST